MDGKSKVSVLYSTDQIQERVTQLAKEIVEQIGSDELILVPVLNGAMIFAADLVRQLSPEIRVKILPVSASSYTHHEKGELLVGPIPDFPAGAKVLIVDDIADTGDTLLTLTAALVGHHHVEQSWSVSLLKRKRENYEWEPDFYGFLLEHDHFVIGYGMDDDGYFRNLPYIGVMEQEEVK